MISSRGRFVWYELMTTDMEAAKAFYADVVGWSTKDASIPGLAYTLFTAGGASVSGLMILSTDARERGARPSWIGYVGTDDIDATAGRIEQLGGIVQVPPTDIHDVSRFAVLSDPQMAWLGLLNWRISGKDRIAEPGIPGHVGWCELLAAEWQNAWTFYGALLGWQKAQVLDIGAMGTYQSFSAEGHTIGGMFDKPPMVTAPFWLYYFNVEDIDAAAARVTPGGGQILYGPIEAFDGNCFVHCTDPQGVMFALMGKRSRDGSGRAHTIEGTWSSEWSGLSLKGRLRITKA